MLRNSRERLLAMADGLSTEQWNAIPEGFVNNIAWNIGHLVSTQQGICYRRAGVPVLISEDFLERYKPESKPEGPVSEAEIEEIKRLFQTLPDRLMEDINNGIFENYVAWTNRYGVVMNNISEAMTLVLFHEGLHFGYVMALKRALQR